MHPHGAGDYVKQVEQARREKDAFFAQSPHSPIPEEERAGFRGLVYYAPDPALRAVARFLPERDPPHVRIQTNTGEVRDYRVLGRLAFEINGTPLTLLAYGHEGAPSLFVPFRDATSGKTTYGAGRYLDLDWEGPSATYAVDFNLAYSPYCAYSDAYSCPFPPRENWLPVPIEAGEKTWRTDS